MTFFQELFSDAFVHYFPRWRDLRSSLLSGQVHRSNIELSASKPVALGFLPFQLTGGHVDNVTLQLPWTKPALRPFIIEAEGLELNFAEVKFPERQSQVFEAFRQIREQQKNRTLAQGEQHQSAALRMLQKFLPMLLNRIEISIKDVTIRVEFSSGDIGTLRLEQFTLGSPESASGQAELSKRLSIIGLAVHVTRQGEAESPKLNVAQPLLEVDIDFSNGLCKIHISVLSAFSCSVSPAMPCFLNYLRRNATRWRQAFFCGRPSVSPSGDPSSWFRYAVGAVHGKCYNTGINMTEGYVRDKLMSFTEYKHLHEQRLHKRNGLAPAEKIRLAQLETDLDAEMILLLRSEARKDAIAEEVSEFATKDWLRRVFFDSELVDEREDLAFEIRQALIAADRLPEATENDHFAATAAGGWSMAKIAVDVKKVEIRVANSICIELWDVSCHGEVDSSFNAWSAWVKVGDINAIDGGYSVFYSGYPSWDREDDKIGVEDSAPWLTVKLYKGSLSKSHTVEANLAPFVVSLNTERLAGYVKYMKAPRGKSCEEAAGTRDCMCSEERLLFGTSALCAKPANSPGFDMSSSLSLRRITILLASAPGDFHMGNHQAISLDLVDFVIAWEDKETPRFSLTCGISMTSFNTAPKSSISKCSGDHNGDAENVYTNSPLKISTSVSLKADPDGVLSTVDEVHIFCKATSLPNFAKFFKEIVKSLNQSSASRQRSSKPVSLPSEDAAIGIWEHQYVTVRVISFVLDYRERSSVANTIAFAFHEVELRKDATEVSFRIGRLSAKEKRHGSKLEISSSPESQASLIMSSRAAPKSEDHVSVAEVTCECFEVLVSPGAIVSVAALVADLKLAFNDVDHSIKGSGVKGPALEDSHLSSSPEQPRFRLNVLFHVLRIHCAGNSISVSLSCKNMYTVSYGKTITCSLDDLRMKDMSGSSGHHHVVIQRIDPLSLDAPDRRAFMINLAPHSTNILISSLRISVMRPFISSIMLLISEVKEDIATKIGREGDALRSSRSPKVSPSGKSHVVTLRGSNVSIVLPVKPDDHEAIGIDFSQVTATFSKNGEVLSLRKLSLLSRTSSLSKGEAEATSADLKPHAWRAVVRGIDLDFTHQYREIPIPSELTTKFKNDWNVNILSRASFFFSSAQVRCVSNVIAGLFTDPSEPRKGHSSNTGSPERTRLSERKSPKITQVLEGNKVTYFQTAVQVETHSVFVNLLKEGDRDKVFIIASLEIEPVRFSLRKAREIQGAGIVTIVSSWKLICPYIRLRDGNPKSTSSGSSVVGIDHNYVHVRHDHIAALRTGLFVEAALRSDNSGRSTKSYHVRFDACRVSILPELLGVLVEFGSLCLCKDAPQDRNGKRNPLSASDSTNNETESTGCRGHDSRKDFDSSFGQDAEPVTKFSVVLSEPVVLLYQHEHLPLECRSHLELHPSLLKVSLLLSKNGSLLKGSHVRMRDVSVVMVGGGALSAEDQRSAVQVERSSSTNMHKSDLRYSTGNEGMSKVFDDQMEASLFREGGSCSVAFCKNITVALPTARHGHFSVRSANLGIDTNAGTFQAFIELIAGLEVLQPVDRDGTVVIPDIQISVGNISLRLRVPTTAVLLSQGHSLRKHTVLRARGSADVTLTGNMERILGKVISSADVVDEELGIFEDVLSPCSMRIDACVSDSVSVRITAEHLIRISLSPLSAKALVGVAQSIRVGKPAIPSGISPKANGAAVSTISSSSGFSTVQVAWEVRGIVLRCLSEEPRSQLLRLVFRELHGLLLFPTTAESKRHVELCLRSFTVEDTRTRIGNTGLIEDGSSYCRPNVVSLQDRSLHGGGRITSSDPFYQHRTLRYITGNTQMSSEDGDVEPHEVIKMSKTAFRMVLSWVIPLEHIRVHTEIRGLDLNIDLAVIETFWEWVRHISDEIQAVTRASRVNVTDDAATAFPPNSRTTSAQVDHIVFEPTEVRIVVQDSQRGQQHTFLDRAMAWFAGSSCTEELVITFPSVILSGSFDSMNQLLSRFQMRYAQALLSRPVLQQFLFSPRALMQISQKLAFSLLRRRFGRSLEVEERGKDESKGSTQRRTSTTGLLSAVGPERVPLATRLRVLPDPGEETESRGTGRGLSSFEDSVGDQSQVVETLDITRNVGTRMGSHPVDGKEVFRKLRNEDPRVPRNERFEKYFPYSFAYALLVTSHFLIFTSRTSHTIQEPIINRSHIVEYHPIGKRITIVCALPVTIAARQVARQRTRDTFSMVRDVSSESKVSEIRMHEIECLSVEYAGWLRSQLPDPNEVLLGFLYPSR